jgi:hypothetical protein
MRAGYDGNLIAAHIEFRCNRAPTFGAFEVTPASGQEFTTPFEFRASDWEDPEDEDFPLLY